MPNSRKSGLALQFVPVKVAPTPPANEAWVPGLPDVKVDGQITDETMGAAANDPPPEDDTDQDTGPGSAALAERFELLPIEWVTGEPAVETLVFELSDGLSYMGESAADDGLEDEAVQDGESEIAIDSESAEGSESGEDNEDGEVDGERDATDLAGDDDSADTEQTTERAAAAVDGGLPPAGFITESDHAAALAAARAEAFAEGLKAGEEQGHSRGLDEGIAQGVEQTRSVLEAEVAARVAALDRMISAIRQSASDPQRLFAPLKRLSVHLAQQLVRGELTQSSDTINRLIEQCLLEFDRSAGTDIVVSLNPDDLERWRRDAPGTVDAFELRADPTLSMGSVRLSVGESAVEDLIEHRLQSLANRLLGESQNRSFPRMTPLRAAPGTAEDISDVE
ncbi:MAG: FliH/SctL family protein [Betaproteobacteria bacterium]